MVKKKKKTKSEIGKSNRNKGSEFERKVRADLEKKGWIVDKWSNNIDFEKDKIVPAKRKYNPYNKVMAIGTGFPDFIAFRNMVDIDGDENEEYKEVIGVEVKSNGYLDKKEREKCKWYLDNDTFSKILIASKIKEGRKIVIDYKGFNNEQPINAENSEP